MKGQSSDEHHLLEEGCASSGALEALLYDWHNAHRLRAQRDDVGYWVELTSTVDRALVVGAGTGRVAVPLARRPTRSVTALDVSLTRLRRMPATPGLTPVCGDIRRLPLRGRFDAVIVPYSTLQLVPTVHDRAQALAEAFRVLGPDGLLHVDVSGSFDVRSDADWHVVFSAPCPAVGVTVVEWERSRMLPDHVLIEKSFRTEDGVVLLAVEERWAFLHALDLDTALHRAGFDVVGVDRGYGEGRSSHRLIYHARRR